VPKRLLILSVCGSLAMFALGCGGGSPKTTTTTGGGGGTNNGGVQFLSPTSAPTIEPGQSVKLEISAPTGDTITWTLQNGNGLGMPVGTLTPSGLSAVYTAPPASTTQSSCSAESSPPSPLQMNVTASDGAGDSASLTIVILQALPCVATTPSIKTCVSTSSATNCTAYPTAGATSIACPAPGTLIPTYAQGSSPQLFVVNTFNSILMYDGGAQTTPPVPFGQPPFTWTVSAGTLPSGLSLSPGTSSSSVVLSGTPVSAGCTAFTLQITDALGEVGTGQFFVVVVPSPISFRITNTVVNSYVGETYQTTPIEALNGVPPYTWAPAFSNGSPLLTPPEDLPPGLQLTFPQNSTAVLSGEPTASGLVNGVATSYPIYLQANDSQSPYPAVGIPTNLPAITANPAPAPTLCAREGTVSASAYGGTSGNVAANAFLKGNYAFMLHGFDANGPVAIAGSIQADGTGKITAGEEDVTRSGGSQTVTVTPASSSYIVGAENNRGCMTLADSSGNTSTFAFTLGSCSNNYALSTGVLGPDQSACGVMVNNGANVPAGLYTTGRMVEFDGNGTRVTGFLRMQDTSSFSGSLSGTYAFGLSGWDSTGKHYAAAGSMSAASGAFSAVAADLNDGGTLASTLTGGSGTVASVDSNGRAAGTITVGSASFSLALYLISRNEAMVATTDLLSATHPIASGEAIATAGPFSAASLQNTHMFHLGGVSGASPDVSIGDITFDGISAFNGTDFENQASTLGKTTPSGLYTVDSNTGRTTFNASGTSLNFDHPFVAYILPPSASLTKANCAVPASCVTGFLVGTDSTAQDGIMEFQTSLTAPPPPFNNQYILGDYAFGVDEALDNLTATAEGFATATANSGSLTAGSLSPGLQDYSYGDPNYCLQSNCTLLVPEEEFAGSYTVNTDGTGTFGGYNGETVSVTNGRTVFYVDESPLNLHPSVVVAEQ